jgi:photosystem II stability/assembly factor-like uncharacterized protein
MQSVRRLLFISTLLMLALLPVGAQQQNQQPTQPAQPASAPEQRPARPEASPASPFAGLRFRSIGPGVTGGRVIAFAVDPKDRAKYFAAVASGGVWKTINSGTTWTSVFDNYGTYSIGAITLDPKDSNILWVGTGERNSQRSVSYGDGVYKSEDGGKSFRKAGLEKSEHIGRIVVDPRDGKVVYVAAQGPLWGGGGERGLFKTSDGGKTWKNVLNISENTGVTDVALDPSNPDILYAAAWQRRRHVWTLINGGPESAIYKSTDAGATWTKLRSGLPQGEMGRVGLAVSPIEPNVVYATVEAEAEGSGIYRLKDRGATWEKMSGQIAQAMYYGQIVCDPKNVDRVYIPNVIFQVSDDGGRTQRPLGEKSKHVDNHTIWIDPQNTDYYLVGSDGGIYESFDRGQNWHFKANMPITQFYDVSVDNSTPFYNVCGGTQDNNSWCGPSRTRSASGITNSDWFVTNGGDGFHTLVDPEDPNTIYATLQYGALVRFDKRTGERINIQPREGKGEQALRWNWDSPLVISPHAHTRLYFASNKLFRSDDRGDSWKVLSPDLTRQLDRDKLPVMGKIWGPDAIAKHQSTSQYGNIVALAESPKREGLIYAGTDDGLIQVTEDGGKTWRKVETFPGVPDKTFVARIRASQHDASTAYAVLNNHKSSDFAPYVLKTTDAGKTWTSIAGNLPKAHPTWSIAEDHVNPNLLFVGTEFGLFFTDDGGQKWTQLRGGLPTIAVRDIAIQKRENDLVVGTFGRGIYILDDYTPLRLTDAKLLTQESHLYPIKDALLYIQSQPLGGRGKAFQGESFYTAENHFGATFTYYLKDALKTKRQLRKDAERKGGEVPYPSKEELSAEAEEEAPMIVLTVTDATGNVVRRLTGPTMTGIQRVTWDLRYPATQLAPPRAPGSENLEEIFGFTPAGHLVMPGKYTVTLSKRANGQWTQLSAPQSFNVATEGWHTMAAADRKTLQDFQQKTARLQRTVNGALSTANELKTKLTTARRALLETPSASEKLIDEVANVDKQLNVILKALRGDTALAARQENLPPSINARVGIVANATRMAISKPTQTQLDQYNIAAQEFDLVLKQLRQLVEVDMAKIEKGMEAAGAPWTPGRVPVWQDR